MKLPQVILDVCEASKQNRVDMRNWWSQTWPTYHLRIDVKQTNKEKTNQDHKYTQNAKSNTHHILMKLLILTIIWV